MLIASLAFLSPCTLGEEYLLSAHMVQHLLITLVVPPAAGDPGLDAAPPAARGPPALGRRAADSRRLLFNLVFAVWHAPPLYQLALVNPVAHAAEHSGLLLLALLTWWPVFGPPGVPPPAPRGAGAYLFFQSLPPTVLGAIIALAEVPIYPFYWQAPGLRALPQADQQLGVDHVDPRRPGLLLRPLGGLLPLAGAPPPGEEPHGTVNPDRARRPA